MNEQEIKKIIDEMENNIKLLAKETVMNLDKICPKEFNNEYKCKAFYTFLTILMSERMGTLE